MDVQNLDKLLINHLIRKGLLPDEKNPVRSWKIGLSKLGGRGVIATRDIPVNELIFEDKCILLGPRSVKKYINICVSCYKSDCPLFPCDYGCGLPVCSNDCELKSNHAENECKSLRELEPITNGSNYSQDLIHSVLPLRALNLSKQDKELINELQGHEKEEVIKGTSATVDLLKKNIKTSLNPENENLMKRVCRVLDTVSFEAAIEHSNSITSLRALYPMGGLLNHQCAPNTRHLFDSNQKLSVYAAKPIKENEEITMTYVDITWDTMLRKHFLKATKHFDCICTRCSDPTEYGTFLGALYCAKDGCPGNVLPSKPLDFKSSWFCSKCNLEIKSKQILSIRSGISSIIEEIRYANPRKLHNFMQKQLSIIIPNTNCIMMDMLFKIVSTFGRSEELPWEELTDKELEIKIEYCQKLLKLLDALNCGECKKKGLILYELYCTYKEKFKRSESVKKENALSAYEINNEQNLQEAIQILKYDIVTPIDYRQIYKSMI